MLVLKAISLQPIHGRGICERIRRMTGEAFRERGSLYLSLERLQRRGWITAAWKTTENNR